MKNCSCPMNAKLIIIRSILLRVIVLSRQKKKLWGSEITCMASVKIQTEKEHKLELFVQNAENHKVNLYQN